MTTYRKTMAEALKDVYLGENNLEKMRKASKGAAQTLKMKDGNLKMDSFTASAIMQIYDKINDKNKKTFEKMMKDGKKADIMKLQKFAMSKISSEYVPEEFEEEFELDEGYEGEVVKVLKKAKIASYFSNGILYVERGDGKDAMAALKKAPNIKELPKVREEEVELDEALEQIKQLEKMLKDLERKKKKNMKSVLKLKN